VAYFPNGTAGMCYEEQYCSRCIHSGDDGVSCNVMLIHNLYNYDQCKDTPEGKAIEAILDLLIPRTKDDLGAEECSMFHEETEHEAAEVERRRLAEQPAKYQAALAETRHAA
jgi:hypothetical protein